MDSSRIKIVSVNIERSKHLDLVVPFLEKQKADVMCMQELCQHDISYFEEVIGARCTFAPVGWHPADTPAEGAVLTGIGIFSRLEVVSVDIHYYAGSEVDALTHAARRTIPNNPLIMCEV